MLLPDINCLLDFGVESLWTLHETEELFWTLVVLEVPGAQHTSDLWGKFWLLLLDDWVEMLRYKEELIFRRDLVKILEGDGLVLLGSWSSISTGRSILCRTATTTALWVATATATMTTTNWWISRARHLLLRIALLRMALPALRAHVGCSQLLRIHKLLGRYALWRIVDRWRTCGVHSGIWHAGRVGATRTLLTLSILGLEVGTTYFAWLSKCNVDWLGTVDTSVHLSHSLGGFLRGGEAHKAKALVITLVVTHGAGRGDCTKRRKFLFEPFITKLIIKVLDVEINTLVLGGKIIAKLGELHAKLSMALSLLLSTRDKQLFAFSVGLAFPFIVIEFFDTLGSILMFFKVDKAKALALTFIVLHDHARRDRTNFFKFRLEFVVGHILWDVFDIHVGKVLETVLHALLFWNKRTYKHLFLTQQHAVDFFNGAVCHLLGFIVHETVALGVTVLIYSNLA
mmetsp:Transcript_3072/g.4484  ORF Transcript_3072/g.4484 Transcript_3072/m.4484 type:complete len:456 (+) Transcript_3072:343-1710(+)